MAETLLAAIERDDQGAVDQWLTDNAQRQLLLDLVGQVGSVSLAKHLVSESGIKQDELLQPAINHRNYYLLGWLLTNSELSVSQLIGQPGLLGMIGQLASGIVPDFSQLTDSKQADCQWQLTFLMPLAEQRLDPQLLLEWVEELLIGYIMSDGVSCLKYLLMRPTAQLIDLNRLRDLAEQHRKTNAAHLLYQTALELY